MNWWLHRAKGRLYGSNLTLRVDDEMLEQLNAEAEKQRISRGELVRTFIEWGLEEKTDANLWNRAA